MTATITNVAGNSLRVRWYMSGGEVYRAYEYSTTPGGSDQATYSRGRTYVSSMGWLIGFWGLDHTVDTVTPAITGGVTEQP